MIIKGKVELTIGGEKFPIGDGMFELKRVKMKPSLPRGPMGPIEGSITFKWPGFCGSLFRHRFGGAGVCRLCGSHRAPARATS